MSNEIIDNLTEEERAAYAEDDGSGQAATTEEANATNDASGTENNGGDGANDAAGAGKGAGADADDTGASADTGAATAEPEAAPPQNAPILVAEVPQDADAKLAEIGTKKADLLTQFDDGDITAKEYQTALDAILKEERAIERQIDKAQLAQEMEQQRLQNEWNSTVSSFLESNKQYKDNPRLYRALDQEVRDVAATDEAKGMTGAQILAKAHANLAEAFGFAAPKQDGTKPTGKQPITKPALPPSLHNVPSAEVEDMSGGKFAALDRLSGIAYEEALSKLSPAEREAYLAS
ncbi:MAG TPA: hypothetical protein VJ652_15040 [Noviherbaspirillum sp.]|nr:hypothetical protein [Noviherbaspirillum sp.]